MTVEASSGTTPKYRWSKLCILNFTPGPHACKPNHIEGKRKPWWNYLIKCQKRERELSLSEVLDQVTSQQPGRVRTQTDWRRGCFTPCGNTTRNQTFTFTFLGEDIWNIYDFLWQRPWRDFPPWPGCNPLHATRHIIIWLGKLRHLPYTRRGLVSLATLSDHYR